MKKLIIILLAFLSFSAYSQAEYEKIAITENVATASTSKIVSQQPGNGELNYINATALPLSVDAINALKLKSYLSTGLIKNGLVTTNADPTKFNITAGIGIISNFDDPDNPTSTIINFPAFTGITPTYLTTGNITYIAINSSSAVVMQATQFTDIQRRDLIILGAVIHSNLTTINLVNNISAPTNSTTNQLHDLMEVIGALNVDGNKYTANGANLSLNKSAGDIFKMGVNFANNWKDPHKLLIAGQTALTFRYRTQNGTEGADRTTIDPSVYDLSNVLTAVPVNKFSIQTVTLFQTGATRIQYGQNVYNTLADAEAAILTRAFVVENNIAMNGITRAYIIVRNNATDLTNATTSKIIEAQKFGGIVSGGVAVTNAAIIAALGFSPENAANKQNSLAVDGSGVKYPTVDAVNGNVIHNNSTAETKIGGLTLGEDLKVINDKWLAFGTSVTDFGKYTDSAAKLFNVDLINYGIAGSSSVSLSSQYSNIPTWTDEFRILSIEHTINDCQTFVPLVDFRANILAMVNNARSKGWADDRIILINGNECSNVLPNNANFYLYAAEVMDLAKDEGLQYFDAYNYTKNNGGPLILTDDGIHPNDFGGEVYARGLIAAIHGGLEIGSGLIVDGGIKTFGGIEAKNDVNTLGSIKTGNDPLNTPTHNVIGDIVIPVNAGINSQFVNNDFQAKITPIEIIGGSELSTTFRNYIADGTIRFFTSGGVAGGQYNALSMFSDGRVFVDNSIISPKFVSSFAGVFPDYLLKADGNLFNGTGLLSGIGTANYIPKYVTGTTMLPSLIYDAGTTIGIGTTTPGELLHIKDAGNTYSMIETSGASNVAGFQIKTPASHWYVRSLGGALAPNNYFSIFNSIGGSGLWVSPTGTLLIATSTDNGTDALQVNGSISATTYTGSASFTGTPTAPTATVGTNTTQIATTEFVQSAMTSGTYTPAITNTTNVSSSTLNAAYYTKIGNIVTVTIAVQVTLTATADTILTFSLPVSGATVVSGIGQANLTSGGGAINAYGIVDITNSTTAQLRMGSTAVVGSGSGIAAITFTYTL